jgi:hypothetical protein
VLAGILLAVAAAVAFVTQPIFVLPQLDADDYRHIDVVRQVRAGHLQPLTACIVENRWDHLWWIDSEEVVRFFRPTMMLSYFADELLHGSSAAGLLLTNALVYLACCLVAAWLLARLLRDTVAALLAGLLFAGFAAHAETIWYVAGRADSLAALAFLGTLALHLAPGRLRWLALPAYAFALATKELTLFVPVLALAADWLASGRAQGLLACLRARRGLYAGYAGLALVYLAARHLVLARAGGTDLPYPYFVVPSHPEFAAHLWHQVRTYGENLLLGGITPPFLRADQVAQWTSSGGTLLACAVPVGLAVLLRRDGRGWWFGLLAACTWLPTSLVYVSERFVFLPSFALAGAAGLVAARAAGAARVAALCLLAVWCAHQTWRLRLKNAAISQAPHDPIAIQEHVQRVAAKLPPGKPIYVLNVPSDVFGAQFFGSLVRVVLRDPARACHVLTIHPEEPGALATSAVERAADAVLDVRGVPALMTRSRWTFPWTSLARGTRVSRPTVGADVEILEGEAEHCRAVRFSLPHRLADCAVLRFTLPDVRIPAPRGEVIRAGRLDLLTP